MTTLSLDSLQQQGAFTGAPVRKEITWKIDGREHTATVYVRRMSYQEAVYDGQAARGKVDPLAGRIAAAICDEHGKPVFTPQDITGEADPQRGTLHRNLTLALMAAISEVNGLGKKPSRSATPRKSGTNSSSKASAGAPSKKRKRA